MPDLNAASLEPLEHEGTALTGLQRNAEVSYEAWKSILECKLVDKQKLYIKEG